MNDLVSAIIIFYNGESFLDEAIQSVFAQTYPDWELLLVDDGSTDRSTEIACRWAEEYTSRVRYIEHEGHANKGMSAARNAGIQQARGSLIAFLDADDVWHPEKLDQQVAAIHAHPEAGMVYGPTQWWFSWTGRAEDQQRDFILPPGFPAGQIIQPPQLLTRYLADEGVSPCTCSVLLRREVLEKVGGFEESFRGMYEDQAFFAKVGVTTPIYMLGECTARYRQHPASASARVQNAGQLPAARRNFLTWLERYLTEKNVQDPQVWSLLKKETQHYRHPALQTLRSRLASSWPGHAIGLLRGAALRALHLPGLRQARMLQLRRLHPLANGRQRGTPIVRYYWGQFLKEHEADIQGTALEVGTIATLRQYGGQALRRADAIDLTAHSPEITIAADLTRADPVRPDQYDCFINQFTMHLIYDVEAALYHSVRLLKPGGILLINFPCVDYYFSHGLDMGTGSPLYMYWWFTPLQVEDLLHRCGLSGSDYQLKVYGNLFTRLAYQMNMPTEELTQKELSYNDPGHPLLVCARVVKPAQWSIPRPVYREPWHMDAEPAVWNPVKGHYAE